MGYILLWKPIANVCFKVYGYMSMSQEVSFFPHFKLSHYMKIPTLSMFLVQFINTIVASGWNSQSESCMWMSGSVKDICNAVRGTIVAGTVNLGVAWWMLSP